MPELPDVEVFTRNLNKIFAGKKLLKIKVVNGQKLKDSAQMLSRSLNNKTLEKIYRSGKEMRFQFSDDILLGLHLMLTGDIFVFDKKNEHGSAIVEMYFEDALGLVLTDRMRNANIKLSPFDKAGLDAISKEVNYEYLKKILNRNTSIKNVLTDQDSIRGIGNSYSDEILWQCRISPFSKANKIPDDKIKELSVTIKKMLKAEISRIYKKFPGKINVEVKDFLLIHSKVHTHSPTGAKIKTVQKGMMKTYFTDEQELYE